MNTLKSLVMAAAVAGVLSSCMSKKGPIDQERADLKASGEKMKSEGEKLIKEGVALQNRAKESRVVSQSYRKQAEILTAQGKADEATQLRLQAEQADAAALASDNEGRDIEAAGLAKIGEAQDLLNRSATLKSQGEYIESSK